MQASSHNGSAATHKSRSIPKSPVGASLLAKASAQPTSQVSDPPPPDPTHKKGDFRPLAVLPGRSPVHQ
ncbi:hypothetical protein F7R05_23175 [Pseudomonas koreensis]|nr:hypothetical protein F7R05_23175 [Pseudomonas koreensis]